MENTQLGGGTMKVEVYLNYTESRVSKYFKEIRIVSEANLPYDKYIKILNNFNKILKHDIDHQTNIVNFIWTLAPRTALLLTVNYAIYNYDGNFWGNFKRDISLKKDHEWKIRFLRQLEFEKLELFNRENGQKYVENILGHAGIPKHNIAGFVKNVIDPAASFDLTVDEVIESVKKEKNYGSIVKTYGLYKSVKDFIKLDNAVSNSLVSRCIEVWREQDRPFTEKYKNYLPDHILEEFEEYASKEITTKIQQTKQHRLARPVLSYSTQYQNIFIKLPIQRFSDKLYEQVEWRLISGDTSINVPTKRYISKEEQEYIVDDKNGEHPVKPLNDYTVHLLIDGEVKGEWSFYLDRVTVFDTVSYEQLNKNYLSNSNMLLIVHENEYKNVENSKNDYLVRPLFDEWQGYYEIDLYLEKPDVFEFSNAVLTLNPMRNLMEIEGARVEGVKAQTDVYTDKPLIKINTAIFSINEDISKWSIKLHHEFSKKTIWKSLSELKFTKAVGEIKIDFSTLFNDREEPFGRYSLSLTGMLGHDQSVDFIYISRKDFSFAIREQNISVLTSPSTDFTIPTIFNVEKKSEIESSFKLPNHPDFVRGNVLNLQTKEKLDFKIYSSKVSCELVTDVGAQKLGETFNSNEFDFEHSHVLLDLENPSLLNDGKSIEVTLRERLKTGEVAQKKFSCRVGRKHILNLNYFEGLHQTNGRRTIGMYISELNVTEKVVTVETEWKIKSVRTPNSNEGFLSFECSFQPEKLKARLWSFDYTKELIGEYEINHPANSLQLTKEMLPDGYYIFELNEVEEDDFFDIFEEVVYPHSSGSHRKFIKVERTVAVPSFVQWLLLLESDGEEKEWELPELEKLLKFIWNNESIIESLLLEDYSSCCDFGLQNIDLLLEIIKKEQNEEFTSFICKVAGYQEWDPASFKVAMQNQLEKKNLSVEYTPVKISLLSSFSRRERALSYQRKIKKAQFFKGFSLHHEYLSFFDKIDNDELHRLKIEDFYEIHKDTLDGLFVSLKKLELISSENINLLNTRRIMSDKDVYDLYSFPFYIGLSALACALVIEHESKMETETLLALRQAVPALYDVAEGWYLHDLVYWKDKLVSDQKTSIILRERKLQYEHPSFAWKR